MAHFAKLDGFNRVISVDVVANSVITDGDGVEQEQLGIDLLTQLYGDEGWYKQTSYNGTIRKNYASTGYAYDSIRDAFIPPQIRGWELNETTCQWIAPVTYPDDGKGYYWNEVTTNWVEVE